jgi:monovalent cation/hydrogen antiporter
VEILLLVVGLLLAAVVLVGVGDRLRLPWPDEALAAARAEVLAARREPGVDPEAADRVLHRLDLRTVLLD